MARLRTWIISAPIAARLVALLLVPVMGLTFFAITSGLGDQARASAALELEQQAERVALLSELASAIDDELEGMVAISEAQTFGFDPTVVSAASGVTLEDRFSSFEARSDAGYEATKVAADKGVVFADQDAVTRALAGQSDLAQARGRSEAVFDSGELARLRLSVSAPIASALQAEVLAFRGAQADLRLGPELVATVDAAGVSSELLNAARAERRALSHFVLPIQLSDGLDARDRLLTSSDRFDAAVVALDRELPESFRLRFDAIKGTAGWQAIDDIAAQALSGGISSLGQADVASQQSSSLVAVIYIQGFERTAKLAELDQLLSLKVAEEAGALAEDAQDRFKVAAAISTVLLLVTLVATVITVRSIVNPLRKLESRAHRIRLGDLHPLGTERPGPANLAKIDLALDDLSAGLSAVEAQTKALSEGRLDDPILELSVPGAIGQSIHGSVARLRKLTASLEYQAKHDRLTALPNRTALVELLDECLTGPIERRIPLVAIMLDLDGFKHANDTMGHPAGDEILVQVGNRILELSPRAFICRLGGDEFMLVMVGEDDEQVGAQVAHQVLDILREPISVSAGTSWISSSFGVVASSNPAWLSSAEVLRRSDLALYEAKDLGPGSVVVFDQRLHDSVVLQNQIEGELRMALANDELSLHLQPIVATSDGSIAGFEGLLRWQPEGRPAISPGVFIPAAERSDLILQIDEWVLNQGCALLQAWQDDPRLRDCTLALNISGRHVATHDLVGRVRAAINKHHVDPAKLVIEVTESKLIPSIDRAEAVLLELRGLGVQLAIDDFGTGYASVAHLRRVKFDELKIDRTFVSKLDDVTERSIASLLVSLGRDLDLDVVAEGIETREQLEWAAQAGCTHGQGFLWARPASPDDIDAMIASVVAIAVPAKV